MSSEVCKQQRRRPACAYLIGAFVIHLESSISKLAVGEISYFCDRLVESRFATNPEDRFSRNEALMIMKDTIDPDKVSAYL